MPKSSDVFGRGSRLAVAGLAAAMLLATVQPSGAGPFGWFKGKDPNQETPQPGTGSGGGGGLFGGLFGGGSRGSQLGTESHDSHKSDLPLGDPEVAMIVNPALGTPTLATQNIAATKAAIEQYKGIVARGGWPTVPAVAMKPGSRGPEIVTLHRRLEVSGDLVGMSVPEEYDAAVVAAVKRFQARHGLPPTGVVDSKATVEALNVPATVRLSQLQANLKRHLYFIDKLASELVVRAWQHGDRMQPLGLDGSKSLQDLLTDRKVPRALRTRLPVVVSLQQRLRRRSGVHRFVRRCTACVRGRRLRIGNL